jgi:hypothetical protein
MAAYDATAAGATRETVAVWNRFAGRVGSFVNEHSAL